jgi:hypothetical protein
MKQKPHDTDNPDCWCNPDLFTICPECGPDIYDCWRCNHPYRGLVPATYPMDADEPLIIAHNDWPPYNRYGG